MFTKKHSPETGLEKAIDKLLSELQGYTADSSEYEDMVDQLVKLHAMKVAETHSRVSKDVLLTIAANLVGILLIVGHEQTHIVTSKALNFVFKLR